ncbi:hypothetical protein PPL_06053 [Heterostelium album PN500]|uniref:Transmembrane protein n=1 Tax=Heterostelium pallidum (strain ATCC 26659 / Pp 5 / PN500) TaxID=670386 RepID=D3BC31_HETP5|nr:hypothetical protein PPL_06053 [Heterostelium album PN500]EFA81214.1 hypothetical protein PPL_06053 [Heterostelium album PN500]|eukprot:XP_020433332.1 hypothetical protein PPL_06053 [Heterostelium album PN500]
MAISVIDVYLRFEGILYALMAMAGFLAPTSMMSMMNWDNLLASEGVIVVEGAEVDEYTRLPLAYHKMAESLVQILIYYTAIFSAFQSLSIFTACFTSNPSLRSALIKLNLFLSLCLIVVNGWIISQKQSIYTETGLYSFWATFIFYVIDFFILSFLTEVIPYLKSMTNKALATTETESKKDKKDKKDKKK